MVNNSFHVAKLYIFTAGNHLAAKGSFSASRTLGWLRAAAEWGIMACCVCVDRVKGALTWEELRHISPGEGSKNIEELHISVAWVPNMRRCPKPFQNCNFWDGNQLFKVILGLTLYAIILITRAYNCLRRILLDSKENMDVLWNNWPTKSRPCCVCGAAMSSTMLNDYVHRWRSQECAKHVEFHLGSKPYGSGCVQTYPNVSKRLSLPQQVRWYSPLMVALC